MILASRNSGDTGISSCANEGCLCVNSLLLLMALKRGLLFTRILLQRQVDGTVGLSKFVIYVNPSNFQTIFSPNRPQSLLFYVRYGRLVAHRGEFGSWFSKNWTHVCNWFAMFSNLRYLLQEASGGDLISHVGRCFVMFLMPWMPLHADLQRDAMRSRCAAEYGRR